jgi:hypothetical protein
MLEVGLIEMLWICGYGAILIVGKVELVVKRY